MSPVKEAGRRRAVSLHTASFILLAVVLAACAVPASTPLPPTEPAPTPVPPTLAPTATPAPQFRIVGYFTEGDIVELVPFDKLTHINYAFLIPEPDGTFAHIANGWKLKALVAAAHEHNVKVLISVGGWGHDEAFERMAADPATRTAFVTNLAQFVDEYGLDGADIDWEYPDPGQSGQNFLALMQELSAVLKPKGKLLTAAVVALGDTGYGIMPETFPLMDFVNIMAYDGGNGPEHSPYQYAAEALAFWKAHGLPQEKTVLGVPFYSRPLEAPYRKLIEASPLAAAGDVVEYSGATVYYNGPATIAAKTELALQQASGIMIWTLSQDTTGDTSLLGTIYQVAHTAQP